VGQVMLCVTIILHVKALYLMDGALCRTAEPFDRPGAQELVAGKRPVAPRLYCGSVLRTTGWGIFRRPQL